MFSNSCKEIRAPLAIALFFVSSAYGTTVTVDSAALFNPTGIFASSSQVFLITATTGTVNLANFDGPYIVDANGTVTTAPPVGSVAYNFFTSQAMPFGVAPAVGSKKILVGFPAQLPGAPYGALVAGFSTLSNPTGFGDFPLGFSLIGSSGIAQAPAGGGFLFLAVNDINNTTDNLGIFTAQITPVPEPSSYLLTMIGLAACCVSLRRAIR